MQDGRDPRVRVRLPYSWRSPKPVIGAALLVSLSRAGRPLERRLGPGRVHDEILLGGEGNA
jgi:hypothetical protein